MDYKNVRCGLEIHCQLNFLQSKLFCDCLSNFDGKNINENTCPVCLGHPGSLPSVNGSAIKLGLKLAKAIRMKIPNTLSFSRKHYDYPDLPKGFQITQNSDGILGINGYLPIKEIEYPIRQIQLEEDPAKLIYTEKEIIVDYNRSGITLIETVTDPVFHSAESIKAFLTQYRRLLLFLEISDTKKEGSFRVDVNVSVGNHPRVEIKNIGSDTEIIKAFHYEIERQRSVSHLSNIVMETRHWDAENGETVKSREKEELFDYKYMNESNIPIIELHEDFINAIKLPELPWTIEEKLLNKNKLTESQITILLDDLYLLHLYEQIDLLKGIKHAVKDRFFWQDYLSFYKDIDAHEDNDIMLRIKNISISNIEDLLKGVSQAKITNKEQKRLLRRHIMKNDPLLINTESSVNYSEIINHLKKNFSKVWDQSKTNSNKINFLVGQGIRYSNGKANAKELRNLILENIPKS